MIGTPTLLGPLESVNGDHSIQQFTCLSSKQINTNQISWTLVRKRTTDWASATGRRILVPTSADRGVSRDQRGGTPTAVNLIFLDRSRYFFFQVAPHLSSRSWVGRVPDPLPLRKSGIAGNRTWDHWVCSQEFWLLEHRGGLSLSSLARIRKQIQFPENCVS
jgi:hypothetical protein